MGETVPEKEKLEKWWKEGGSKLQKGVPSREESIDFKGHYFQVRGIFTSFFNNVEKPPYYLSCPKESGSMAKVTEQNGKWYCEKTGESYDTYSARYVLRSVFSDWSSGEFTSNFNDVAEQILKTPASTLEKHVSSKDNESFDAVFQKAVPKFQQRLSRSPGCLRNLQRGHVGLL